MRPVNRMHSRGHCRRPGKCFWIWPKTAVPIVEGLRESRILNKQRRLVGKLSTSKMNSSEPDISLRDFQRLIKTMYYEKDVERGVSGTFMWLMEEIGELATALRTDKDRANLEEEFADVVAWLTTIANVAGVDLSQALQKKYGNGCPGCGRLSCECPIGEKP